MVETHSFLGSNSPTGFLSLYDGITDSFKETLYIIKGFPGSGKSSFMKRIGKALSEAGADIEYIHCSGDPDSLDGIYFPQLAVAYADGTAPHVIEPRIAGAGETYINLGAFCRTADLAPHRREIADLTADYRKMYIKAYSSLSAAAAVRSALIPEITHEANLAVSRRATGSILRRFPDKKIGKGKILRRFLRAFTCKGEVIFHSTVAALADEIIILGNELSLAPIFTAVAGDMIQKRGYDALHFISPDGNSIEHIVVPEVGLAFVSGLNSAFFSDKKCRHIRLDLLIQEDTRRTDIKKARFANNLAETLTAESISHLANAKALHDKLEQLYIPHIDFEGLTLTAERHIEQLLQLWTKKIN